MRLVWPIRTLPFWSETPGWAPLVLPRTLPAAHCGSRLAQRTFANSRLVLWDRRDSTDNLRVLVETVAEVPPEPQVLAEEGGL